MMWMDTEEDSWYILNDFLVEKTIVEDALGFLPEWKEPCIILYRDDDQPGKPAGHDLCQTCALAN